MRPAAHPMPTGPSATGADAWPSPGGPSTCPLWHRIEALGVRTLAVMGMTKNTGKTVCLNHLLARAHAAHRDVGLTSIGRDGEERDEVFSIPKPPVKVLPGCLVATAEGTLRRSRARTRHIGATGIDSPMGEILIVRALAAGEMEVAGASRGHDQRQVIALLRQCGADMVFLDGALGRSHHASPALADGVVLATGAALGGGVADVLRKTRDRLAILGVEAVAGKQADQVRAVFEREGQGAVGVWSKAGECLFDEAIATVNAASTLRAWSDEAAQGIGTIAMSGAVGKRLWQTLHALLERHPGLRVVVADGTRLFIDANDLAMFERQGGQVRAWRGIRLAGLSVNPFSPFGGSFDAAGFLNEARLAFPRHAVADVMLASEGP